MLSKIITAAIVLLPCFITTQAQQIFKCVNLDGTTMFANVPCTKPEGKAEALTLKINQVGSLATPDMIDRYNAENQANSTTEKTTPQENQFAAPQKNESRKTVVERCNTIGTSTFCKDSEGNKTVTNRMGNTEFIKETDADGNVKRKTVHNY
ncbi:hypothetical protein ACUTAF_15345 [Pseudomonas sp. SP16.1]|uniref:hypothetical protein n=1 Tax=Pseudomonas sp. SP16.1 TaxID=3458854 RepID=UPI004046667D